MSAEGPSSSPAPGAPNEAKCRACGAPNDPAASECWLCQRRDWRERPAGRRPPKAAARLGDAMGPVRLGALFLAFLSLMALAPFPGVGVLGLVLVLGGWAAVETKSRRRYLQGRPMSCLEMALWLFVLSVVFVLGLSIAAIVACFYFLARDTF